MPRPPGEAFPDDALEARLAHFGEALLARLQALKAQRLREHHALKPLLSVNDIADGGIGVRVV